MWTKECTAQTTKGKKCTRKSTTGLYCFSFQGEKFNHPTWVEVCSQHMDFTSYITSVKISS